MRRWPCRRSRRRDSASAASPVPEGTTPVKPDDAAPPARTTPIARRSSCSATTCGSSPKAWSCSSRILHDSSHSRYRTHAYAAVVGTWSRVYAAMADACLLVTRGSYASVPNLVRSACELIAAQYQVQHEEMGEFIGWMLGHLKPDEEHKAFDVGLGHYFAGTTLAARPGLARRLPRRERPRAPELRRDAARSRPGVQQPAPRVRLRRRVVSRRLGGDRAGLAAAALRAPARRRRAHARRAEHHRRDARRRRGLRPPRAGGARQRHPRPHRRGRVGRLQALALSTTSAASPPARRRSICSRRCQS